MSTPTTSRPPSQQSAGVINWKVVVVRFVIVGVLMPLVLLIAAGRIDWWQAWVYIAVLLVVTFLSRYLVFRKHPEVITERARFTSAEGAKSWDKPLVLILSIIGPLVAFVVAGLDKRNAWSPDIPLALEIAAIILFVLGAALATWAMIENPFFSAVVRIQKERGQTVITTGPYQFVRHPSYSGGIISWLVTPVMLGTLWAFVPALLVIVGVVIRTALEDRTLLAELPGYTDYARQTRYRLLPGIW